MPLRTKLPKGHKFGSVANPSSVQPGNLKYDSGVIYFWTTKDNAVTNDSSQYVAVKIGLAVGGELDCWEIMQGSRTKCCGDQIILDILPVANCGWSEEYMHMIMRKQGYSTLHNYDHNVPERYKHFYEEQAGGNEWFVVTTHMLDKFRKRLSEKSVAKHGQPEPNERRWVGRTSKNPPIKFRLAADGTPTADMQGRRGGPIKEQKLKFIWDFRTLSGTAPEGCISTSPEWVAAR